MPLSTAEKNSVEILVVDDSRLQAKILKDLLVANSFAVRVAADGRQALTMTREQRPTLIISDIVMPVMNGYELCAALKSDPVLCTIPVVLLTSLSDTEDIVQGLQARADYYLTKPYSHDYLLSTLESLLMQPPHTPDEYLNTEIVSPIEIVLHGTHHTITAGRRQMLNLLLSTYGNAVQQNRSLQQAQAELQALNDQLREQAERIIEQQALLEAANERLKSLATHDGLTGLKNHRAFKERLADELASATRYGQPLSLIMLDVDYFKQFNDQFGHPAGDDVLRTVGQILCRECRTTDFVARYGGEEFAALLPSTQAQDAMQQAERLRNAIESENWALRPITASFGVATFAQIDAQTEADAALLEAADQALYMSKRSGRNRATHAEQAALASSN